MLEKVKILVWLIWGLVGLISLGMSIWASLFYRKFYKGLCEKKTEEDE